MSLKPFFRWVGTRLGCIMCDAVCSTCQLKNLLSRVGRSQFRHLPKHGLKYKVNLGLDVGLHNICKIQCSFNTSGFTIFHIIPSKRFQSALGFMVTVGSCIFVNTEIWFEGAEQKCHLYLAFKRQICQRNTQWLDFKERALFALETKICSYFLSLEQRCCNHCDFSSER